MTTSRERGTQKIRRARPGFIGLVSILVPVLFLVVFFLVPAGYMLSYSFQTYHPIKLVVPEFTLENYLAVFTDEYTTNILMRTITVSLATTVVCAIVAYPIAYRMRQATGFEKLLLSLIAFTPLMVSLVVLGYSWIIILAPNTGLVNTILGALGLPPVKIMFTQAGLVVGLAYANVVFMIISLHASLENIDESLLRAARILGSTSIQVFRRVIFPLSLPGLVSGSLIVFSISASSFVMPRMLGGRQTPVLATYAYDQASYLLNWPTASAIAAVLVVIAGSTNLVYTSWIRTVERRLGILDEEAAG